MRQIRYVAQVLVTLLVVSDGDGSDLLDRVRREVPAAAERIQDFYSGKEYECEESSEELVPDPRQSSKLVVLTRYKRTATVYCAQSHACIEGLMNAAKPSEDAESMAEIMSSMLELNHTFAWILNPDYCAIVDLTSSPSLDTVCFAGSRGYARYSFDWLLTCAPPLRFSEYLGLRWNFNRSVGQQITFSQDHWSERDVVLSPTSAKLIENGRVQIALRRFPEPAPQVSYQATLTLDPNRDWSVVKFVESLQDNGSNRTRRRVYSCEYPDDKQDVHPTRASMKTTYSGLDPGESVWSANYSPLVSSKKRLSDFRLTAYGFPEPKKRSRRSPMIYVVAAVVTGFAVVAVPYIRRLHARAK